MISTTGISRAESQLTICLLRSLSEIVLDVEALRLRVLRVRVGPVSDDDFVVRDARVTEVLRLGGTLVTEAAESRGYQSPQIVVDSRCPFTPGRRSSCP